MLTIPVPNFDDDPDGTQSDAWYNSGLLTFNGFRDAEGIVEGLNDLLKRNGLQIVSWDNGSTDAVYSIAPLESTREAIEEAIRLHIENN